MKTYEQVLETVQIALSKGEYLFCIEFLSPIIDLYPLSSKEGSSLRIILITALCGINRKEDAKKFCKELLKSYDYKSRENAKYFLEIIDSPEIKKPENWNIRFEKASKLTNKLSNSFNSNKRTLEEKKFINVNHSPTGEMKPFQKGFSFIILIILLLLIPLLSGCVKIENTIDLTEIDSVTNNFTIESKYIKKFAWQKQFEETIKNIFPDSEISIQESNFSLRSDHLKLEEIELTLNKLQKAAEQLTGSPVNLKINSNEQNFTLLKKYNFKIEFNLKDLPEIEDLEINLKILNPNKAIFIDSNNSKEEVSNKLIIWNLSPGQKNILEFSFWIWNKLLIGVALITMVILSAYLIRFFRFKIGSDLPQLPSQ